MRYRAKSLGGTERPGTSRENVMPKTPSEDFRNGYSLLDGGMRGMRKATHQRPETPTTRDCCISAADLAEHCPSLFAFPGSGAWSMHELTQPRLPLVKPHGWGRLPTVSTPPPGWPSAGAVQHLRPIPSQKLNPGTNTGSQTVKAAAIGAWSPPDFREPVSGGSSSGLAAGRIFSSPRGAQVAPQSRSRSAKGRPRAKARKGVQCLPTLLGLQQQQPCRCARYGSEKVRKVLPIWCRNNAC